MIHILSILSVFISNVVINIHILKVKRGAIVLYHHNGKKTYSIWLGLLPFKKNFGMELFHRNVTDNFWKWQWKFNRTGLKLLSGVSQILCWSCSTGSRESLSKWLSSQQENYKFCFSLETDTIIRSAILKGLMHCIKKLNWQLLLMKHCWKLVLPLTILSPCDVNFSGPFMTRNKVISILE